MELRINEYAKQAILFQLSKDNYSRQFIELFDYADMKMNSVRNSQTYHN